METQFSPTVENLAKSMALGVLGASLIGLILWLTIVPLLDLFNFLLFWILPILGLALGLGLISASSLLTAKALFTKGMLRERVMSTVSDIKNSQKTIIPDQEVKIPTK